MLYKSHLLLLELWDMVDMVDGYCFYGPKWPFLSMLLSLGLYWTAWDRLYAGL